MSHHSHSDEEKEEGTEPEINWTSANLRGLDGLLVPVREEQNQLLDAAGLGDCTNFMDAVKILYKRSLGADEQEVSSNFHYYSQ